MGIFGNGKERLGYSLSGLSIVLVPASLGNALFPILDRQDTRLSRFSFLHWLLGLVKKNISFLNRNGKKSVRKDTVLRGGRRKNKRIISSDLRKREEKGGRRLEEGGSFLPFLGQIP